MIKPLIVLLLTIFSLSYAQTADSFNCNREEMLRLNNKVRQDPKWIAAEINKMYPESDYYKYSKEDLFYILDAKAFYINNPNLPVYPTLELVDAYNIAAAEHAHHMYYYNHNTHTGCCNDRPWNRVEQYAYTKGITIGENLWWIQEWTRKFTCLRVLIDLISSKGHRDIIYKTQIKYVGIGFGGDIPEGDPNKWTEPMKSNVVFVYASDFKGAKPATQKQMYLAGSYLQNVSCPNNGQFSGKNGINIVPTCNVTNSLQTENPALIPATVNTTKNTTVTPKVTVPQTKVNPTTKPKSTQGMVPEPTVSTIKQTTVVPNVTVAKTTVNTANNVTVDKATVNATKNTTVTNILPNGNVATLNATKTQTLLKM